jgi:predicted ABC-type transport system involved in lysophospholipase L1 biosynthesis ATPase subunit
VAGAARKRSFAALMRLRSRSELLEAVGPTDRLKHRPDELSGG